MAGPLRIPVGEPRDAPRDTVRELRERMHRMAGGVPRSAMPMPAGLAGLVRLRTGGSYRVDDTSLILALLAASSREGAWTAVVGVGDLGIEAAAEAGLALERTVVVPDPGEHWLEVTAALLDVLPVVWLRSPGRVPERTAGRLGARLRKRAATLLVQGAWPGCEARLWVAETSWEGIGQGHGRLHSRRARIACRRGSAPERYAEAWFPDQRDRSLDVPAVGRPETVGIDVSVDADDATRWGPDEGGRMRGAG